MPQLAESRKASYARAAPQSSLPLMLKTLVIASVPVIVTEL
jgi:hypothetical protein